jgi:tetratricopeptide (TPR) repeat protein
VSPRRAKPSPPKPVAAPAIPDRPWLLFVGLAVVTLAAYQPAWHGGLLWDDVAHLTAPALTSWHGLGQIWTDFTATQQYYPVVNSAFWLMNRLWGHATLGYHLVNILLHACSAVLLARLLRRWSVPGAMVAAAIFALHPVHVESVAWMSELKNTLSGVCYLLAATAYVRFDETRDRRAYALALGAFVLALGSKTVTATLPGALLIVLWWRRGRIEWRRDVMPLLPFFATGLAAGLGTAWIEYALVGAQGSSFELTMLERVLLAGRAAWFYAAAIVWPVGLIFNYPRWSISQGVWWQYLFPLALAAVLAGLWAIRGRTRAPLAAALFFLCTLFPALGFVNVYPFRYSFVADHFQYLASLGLIVALAAGLVVVARRWRPGLHEMAVAVMVAMPLFVLTYLQSRQYADSDTLYRTTITRNPSSLLAATNLSGDLLDRGPESLAEAEQLAQAAVRIGPQDPAAHNNLGLAWQKMGRTDDALREHRETVRLDPNMAAGWVNVAIDLVSLGRMDEAAQAYETSLRILPNQPKVLHNLAIVLVGLRRVDEAVGRMREAARLSPGSPEIFENLADTLQATGDFEGAIAAYAAILRVTPESGQTYHNMAVALVRAGRREEALGAFQEAARLMPESGLVQMSMATVLVSLNRLEEALPHFARAIQTIEPAGAADAHNEFGVALARLGRLDQAAKEFEAALALRPDFPVARDNLARARRGR